MAKFSKKIAPAALFSFLSFLVKFLKFCPCGTKFSPILNRIFKFFQIFAPAARNFRAPTIAKIFFKGQPPPVRNSWRRPWLLKLLKFSLYFFKLFLCLFYGGIYKCSATLIGYSIFFSNIFLIIIKKISLTIIPKPNIPCLLLHLYSNFPLFLHEYFNSK